MQNAWSFFMQCWAYAWLFLRLLQVLCKLLAKGLTNWINHDIIHARLEQVVAWRRTKNGLVAWALSSFGEKRDFCIHEKKWVCICTFYLSTKSKLHMNTKMPCIAKHRRLYKSVRLQVNNIKRRLCKICRAFFCALKLCGWLFIAIWSLRLSFTGREAYALYN